MTLRTSDPDTIVATAADQPYPLVECRGRRGLINLLYVVTLLLVMPGCGVIHLQDRPASGLEQEDDFGPPLTDIRIEGLEYTKRWVVINQLASRVGQPYTEELARRDYRNLDLLKVFSSIQFEVEPEGEGVVLIIRVTEVNPYTPSVKVGITDENGLSFGLGGSSGNLLGTALKASASFNAGGESGVKLGLSSPWRPGKVLTYDIRFSWQVRDNKSDQFRENAVELTSYGQYNLGAKWRGGATFKFYSIGSDVPGITLSPDNRDNVPLLGAFIGFDSRDNPRNPGNGLFAYLDVGRSGGFLGGDADYWRGNLDLRAYWSPWKRHTLALFSFNTQTSGDVGEEIPVWDDFHIGGTNTIRGWTFGARFGRNQYITTVEYRYLLIEPKLFQLWFLKMDVGLQLAAFYDAGTAFTAVDRPQDDFISGGGIGLRLLLPSVDMLRFDLAVGESFKPDVKVTFHIGANSKAMSQRNRVR